MPVAFLHIGAFVQDQNILFQVPSIVQSATHTPSKKHNMGNHTGMKATRNSDVHFGASDQHLSVLVTLRV